jgi:hypothetical protein
MSAMVVSFLSVFSNQKDLHLSIARFCADVNRYGKDFTGKFCFSVKIGLFPKI